jgi:hypothetical protein
MTPEDLATRYPRLYHVTEPDAVTGILRHGLLPTSDLLTLFEVRSDLRRTIECERRPTSVSLTHPVHGRATIADNSPLSMRVLAACLDDGLSPVDWLRLLNSRVFFWADRKGLQSLLGSRLNRTRDRAVLVVDTLSLASRHADRIELSPINSGSTIRRPVRRGLATFTPLGAHSFDTWRRLRGRQDHVREVTVVGGVADVTSHLVEVQQIRGRQA